jgi:hypothetical protein
MFPTVSADLPVGCASHFDRRLGCANWMVVGLGYAGVSPEVALVLSVILGMTVLVGSLPGLLFMTGLFPDRRSPLADEQAAR